jgi:hypothetical protein
MSARVKCNINKVLVQTGNTVRESEVSRVKSRVPSKRAMRARYKDKEVRSWLVGIGSERPVTRDARAVPVSIIVRGSGFHTHS